MAIHSILLVAARTATDPYLLAAVRARAAETAVALTLLVPAIPPKGTWTWDEQQVERGARDRMRSLTATLARLEIVAHPVLGDADLVGSVRDELRSHAFDEIVISAPSSRLSRWMGLDPVTRVARGFPGRVTSVADIAAIDGRSPMLRPAA
jgi:hypothetical protein